ncbi:MAG: serine/threonine-protein kinase [Dehalococcoidia bacterium]|nr:serine/threonine protein kinase [Dehalococcoidia bacterium]MCB9486246.1 serine/threonine protein kinase [Thermoflexaceae bacterium]
MGSTPGSQPTVLKSYELQKELGRGAMGAVWLGRDRRDASRVAVKLLHPHLGGDPEFRGRFEREAHVAALLRSPYTVHLIDFGVTEGTCYLVMEFIEGHNVGDELKHGPIEPARALRIATEIARALEEAGARGVAHRDIKPDNVLLDTDDRVKVTDFGIARQTSSAGMTTAGMFVGTPAYAAPEQADGEFDHRVDIYSTGATLFAMLTGHPPYRGNSVMDILQQHRYASLPTAELEGLPDAVVNVIRRCMEKDPRDRYQTATDLVGALERASLAYAQLQQHGATPQYSTGARRPPVTTSAGTVPIPPPTQQAPRRPTGPTTPPPQQGGAMSQATRVQGPPPGRSIPAGAGLASALRTELSLKTAPGRSGDARYSLSLANTGNGLLRVRLVPTDQSGVLQVSLPGRAAIPPGTTVLLDVAVQPRMRRSKGPDRRLSFGVTVVDETSGDTVAATAAEYLDSVGGGGGGSGGGSRHILIGLVAAVVVIGGAAAAYLVLGGSGDDTPGGSTATPTVDGRPGMPAGQVGFNLTVDSNSCTFGLQPGAMHGLAFIFTPVGGGDTLREGDSVDVAGVRDDGAKVPLGKATFHLSDFEFGYPVEAGSATGTGKIVASFTDKGAIKSAKLLERYTVGGTPCEIVASQ